eukprot:6480720-Pyramimonas_sp.AAC.1
MASTTPAPSLLPLSERMRSDWVRGMRVLREASDQAVSDFEARARRNSVRAQRAVLNNTPTCPHQWVTQKDQAGGRALYSRRRDKP